MKELLEELIELRERLELLSLITERMGVMLEKKKNVQP